MDWIKTSAGEIVNKNNIDSYMPQMSKTNAEALAKSIYDESVAVTAGTRSWEGYFNTLNNTNRGYVVDLIKNTDDLSKLTGDDLVKANQNARQAAIAHNAALKQQTLGAKAAKFAMSALATVGNMIVFTLISKGISKLMNIETKALEKAQSSYESAVEEVNKLNEREDVALSSAKELSDLFSDEDWGSESAKRASDIYNEMADRLEDVGGAEDDRIQQLRNEAKQIRENIGLSKEERLAKAEEGRKKALTDSGWDKQSNITKYEDKVNSAEDTFWKTVEKEFSSFWNMSNYDGNVHALSGNVLKTDGTATNPTDVSDEIIKTMGDLLFYHYDDGAEYVKLADVSGTDGSQYAAAIEFMKRFEKIQELPDVSNDALYKSLKEIYDKLLPTYSEINKAKNKLPIQKAKKDAYDYFNKNGFNFDNKDSENAFVKFLKDKKYDQKVIDSLLKDLENGGFYSEEYWKDIEKASGNVDKMTVSLSDLESTSEKIKTLSSAFKELSDDGYISFDTITKIKDVVGDSVSNWDYYEKALLGAKLGTAQTTEMLDNMTFAMLEEGIGLSELANADQEYIEILLRRCGVTDAATKSIEYKARAQSKERIQSALSKKTTDDKVNALKEEAGACGITKNAYIELVAQEILFGNTDMNFEEKINGLYDTAEAAGMLSGELSRAKEILDSINWEDGTTKADIADKFGLESKYETDENGNYVYVARKGINGEYLDENGKEVDSADKAQKVRNKLYAQDINGVKVWHDSMTVPMEYKILDSLTKQSTVNYTPSSSSSSNTPDYEDPTDAIINKINLKHRETERQEEYIKDALEVAEIKDDYEKQYSLTNDLIDTRKKRIGELSVANTELHNYADKLRNSTPDWKEEEWFDSQGNATEAYNSFIEKQIKAGATTEDIEAIKDQFERLSKIKEAYADNEKERLNLNKQILKDEENISKIYDSMMSEIDRYTERTIKGLEKQSEILDDRISKQEALLQIKEKEYDMENKLADAQREIDKAIEDSLISEKHLNDKERAEIFNLDDYKELSKEIKSIQIETDQMATEYYNKIRKLGEDELYLKEEITAEYERQLAAKERELEIAKAEVNLKKKQQALDNILAEKNVRFLNEKGEWEWIADQDKVRQATNDLLDAEYEMKSLEKKNAQQRDIDRRQATIDSINSEKAAYEQHIEMINEKTEDLKTALEDMQNPIKNMSTLLEEFNKMGVTQLGKGLDDLLSVIAKVTNKDYDSVYDSMASKSSDGSTSSAVSGSRWGGGSGGSLAEYIKRSKARNGGYASGTKSATPGLHEVDELGEEVFITPEGVLKKFSGGEIVFNHLQTERLYEMVNLPKPPSYLDIPKFNAPQAIDKSQNFYGGITVVQPTDLNDFVRQLTNKIRNN